MDTLISFISNHARSLIIFILSIVFAVGMYKWYKKISGTNPNQQQNNAQNQNQGSGTQHNPAPAPAPAPTAVKKPWVKWLVAIGCIALLFFFGKPIWNYFNRSWKDSGNVVYKEDSTWWILMDKAHTSSDGWSEWIDIPHIDGGNINFHFTDGQVLMERENGDQFYMTSSKDSIRFTAVPGRCTHPLEEVALNTKFKFKAITPGIKFVSMQFQYPLVRVTKPAPVVNQHGNAKESKSVKIFVIDFKKHKTSTSCAKKNQPEKKDRWKTVTEVPNEKWGTR